MAKHYGWIYDTGADLHIANTADQFTHIGYRDNLPLVTTANGLICPTCIGSYELHCPVGKSSTILTLNDVVLLPCCDYNLIYGRIFFNAGGSNDKQGFYMNGVKMEKFVPETMKIVHTMSHFAYLAAIEAINYELWHRRLDHTSLDTV